MNDEGKAEIGGAKNSGKNKQMMKQMTRGCIWNEKLVKKNNWMEHMERHMLVVAVSPCDHFWISEATKMPVTKKVR